MANSRSVLALLMSGVLAAGLGGTAAAQSYPSKPIELVVPTSAGSGTDVYARAMADIARKEKLLPQPFVIQNRTGGGSVIAYNYFKTKKGDPHVMLAATGSIVIMAARPDVNIPLEHYTPIANFANDPQAIMVGADSPYQTLKDLVEAARKQPDTIVCAITNPLGSGRLVVHLLEKAAPGAKFKFITFKGGGEAVTAVAGGHAHFTTENLSEGLGLYEAKKLRVLAVTSQKRMPLHPDLPTATEAGYRMEAGTIRGFVLPPDVPKQVAALMESVLEKVHKSQAWQEHAKRNHYEDRYLAGADYAKFLQERLVEYREFFKEVGATVKP